MAFDPLTLLILKYRGRSVAVFREHCLSHENLLAVARRTFPSLQGVSTGDLVLVVSIPGYPDTEPVEILPEIWTTVCQGGVHAVTMALESEMQSTSDGTTTCGSPFIITSPPRPAPQPPRQGPLSLFKLPPIRRDPPVQSEAQQSSDVLQAINISFPAYLRPAPASFDVSEPGLLGKKISRLYELIDPKVGYTASNSKFIFGNSYLNNERTFSDYGIVSGDTILLNPGSRPRKPVIYLYPPSSLADVTIELALASSWSFSAVHPPPRTTVPPGEPYTAQSLTWTVAAEPDGTLVDKISGMEVSYLYWEAVASAQPVTPGSSRATTPIADIETFDPAHPSVKPGDSVLLPTSKVPGYLDVVLKALALHTEARTSFITLRIRFFLTPSIFVFRGKRKTLTADLRDRFWLPDMLKHEYVALRFVAQEAYERAAPMHIAPAPDVVTRVFMLFRGVPVSDLGLWEAASVRAGADGARFWAGVVGVDAARAADSGLFRVLEWGGMEVQ
ncbi:hypothetical protein EDB92DRAFT_1958976 [Lactarius akahatsu]|uniref:Ubiquitin-like domain-containing protein n=1 Tax=Lactarius akahatsu TaxID=416441 RepID=A0AAD4Q716_9AGAM|nr:hypothetical protein EDB92DRAFT_1958976 [Lactarius akahatsu]